MALNNSVFVFCCFVFVSCFFVSHSHHKIILQSIFIPRVCTTPEIVENP